MLDFSNEIFSAVAKDLRSRYEGIKVVGEYVDTPTAFPTVTIDEIQNIPVHQDSAVHNKYAEVVYRVQVFSNAKSGKRSQAREIYGAVDEVLQTLGLYAITFTTTPAIYNSEIYSITATYRGVVDRNGVIYRG
jgi:stress-induced morphogen